MVCSARDLASSVVGALAFILAETLQSLVSAPAYFYIAEACIYGQLLDSCHWGRDLFYPFVSLFDQTSHTRTANEDCCDSADKQQCF